MAECDWIILCDYAFPDMRGKLCLIGAFDVIFAPNVPVKHERAAIGFSIVGEPGERVQMKLDIIGPTGQVVMKAPPQTFTLPDSGGAQGQIDVRNLVLKDFGRHAIQIDLGEGAPRSAWFTLRPTQTAP